MAQMLIMPQDWPKRLHEWVAVERGYFDEVGLAYRFRGSPPEWDELRPGGFVRQAHEAMVATEPTGFCDCSCQFLAQNTHSDTPLEKGRKALLERLRQGM